MTTFNKTQLKALRTAMQKALDEAGLDGMTIEVGNCSYSGGEATYKVKVLLDGAETQEQQDLQMYAKMFGLDLDKIYTTVDGKSLKLSGYNSRARKTPYLVNQLGTDNIYRISPNQAHLWFAQANS